MMRTGGCDASLPPCADPSSLRPILGIVQRGVITGHAQHGGRNAHVDAGFVHHVEHAMQALTWSADQVSHGTGAVAVKATSVLNTEYLPSPKFSSVLVVPRQSSL